MDTMTKCRDICIFHSTLCEMKSRMLSRGKEARQSPQVTVSGDRLAGILIGKEIICRLLIGQQALWRPLIGQYSQCGQSLVRRILRSDACCVRGGLL